MQQQQKLTGKCTFLSIINSLSWDRSVFYPSNSSNTFLKLASRPLSIFTSLRYSDKSYFACVTGRDVRVDIFLGVVSLVRINFNEQMTRVWFRLISVWWCVARFYRNKEWKNTEGPHGQRLYKERYVNFISQRETSSYTVFNRVSYKVIVKLLGSNSDENFIPLWSVKISQDGNGLYTNSNSIIGR